MMPIVTLKPDPTVLAFLETVAAKVAAMPAWQQGVLAALERSTNAEARECEAHKESTAPDGHPL